MEYQVFPQEDTTNNWFTDLIIQKWNTCVIIEWKSSESLKKAIPQIRAQYYDYYKKKWLDVILLWIHREPKKNKITCVLEQ
jgi:Holliday junction resolvase-like predicted endonuclease